MISKKPIFLVLCLIGAASMIAAPTIGTPALASNHYTEKYLRCYEYSESSDDHSDADYNFEYENKWYYCWDYDKDSDDSSNSNNNGY